MTAHGRLVIGIDPGGQHTGLVVLAGSEVITWSLYSRSGRSLNQYITDTVDAVADIAAELAPSLIGIEDTNRPNPHLGMTNPQGLLDTNRMIGALIWGLTSGNRGMLSGSGYSWSRGCPGSRYRRRFSTP